MAKRIADKPHAFTERDFKRIAKVVQRVENMPHNDPYQAKRWHPSGEGGTVIISARLISNIGAKQIAPAVKALKYVEGMVNPNNPAQGGTAVLSQADTIDVINFHDTAFLSTTKIQVRPWGDGLWVILQADCGPDTSTPPPPPPPPDEEDTPCSGTPPLCQVNETPQCINGQWVCVPGDGPGPEDPLPCPPEDTPTSCTGLFPVPCCVNGVWMCCSINGIPEPIPGGGGLFPDPP